MKKLNAGVIGYGKWGKIFVKQLNKVAKIKFILNSSDKLPNKLVNIDWIFILSSNKTHEKFVSLILKKKINVFCEKPLTESFSTSQKLLKLSQKNKVKLYVDNIEKFKNKIIRLNKNNFIKRGKYFRKKQSFKEILFKLFYHDAYLLYDSIKAKKIKQIKIIKTDNQLNVDINYSKFQLNFIYSLKEKKSYHQINNVNLRKYNGNPLLKMITKVLNNQCNYIENRNSALFANSLIEKLLNSKYFKR